MVKGWTVLTVREEVKAKLKQLYENDKKRPKNQAFNAYLDNFLSEYIDYQEKLQQYGAFLKYYNADDNHIFIFDSFINQFVTLTINAEKKAVHCDYDNSLGCVHVGFAYGVQKVYDVLISRGFRPPKKID